MQVSSKLLGGIAVGVGLGGVAFVLAGAVRRLGATLVAVEDQGIIDGIRPLEPAALAAQPTPEANSFPLPLESERRDPPAESQRW